MCFVETGINFNSWWVLSIFRLLMFNQCEVGKDYLVQS